MSVCFCSHTPHKGSTQSNQSGMESWLGCGVTRRALKRRPAGKFRTLVPPSSSCGHSLKSFTLSLRPVKPVAPYWWLTGFCLVFFCIAMKLPVDHLTLILLFSCFFWPSREGIKGTQGRRRKRNENVPQGNTPAASTQITESTTTLGPWRFNTGDQLAASLNQSPNEPNSERCTAGAWKPASPGEKRETAHQHKKGSPNKCVQRWFL